MSAFFETLEHDLVDAAARRAGTVPARRRRRWPGLLLATLLCLGVGGATAGGALYVLRGEVIPAPAARDVPLEQLPRAGSSQLTQARAADPEAGAPDWALRLAESRTGFMCSTVGQLQDGRFGLVGLDGRFRELPERGVDGCGETRENAASLIGVRVFDARRRADVRSVVYGVGGETLRSVELTMGGGVQPLDVGAGGVFLAATAGYPEDVGMRLALRFADGHVERHPLGTSPYVVPDPEGAGAWRAEVSTGGLPADYLSCVRILPARAVRNPPVSPAACGDDGDQVRRPRGWFFTARRLVHGSGSLPAIDADGRWGRGPSRTAVWGLANSDIARIELLRLGEPPQRLAPAPNRAFLAMLPAAVDPATLRLRVTHDDGRVETRTGSANLVEGVAP